jgi:DNA polymerase III sliding clamp (beta) subunit (PCNA family)
MIVNTENLKYALTVVGNTHNRNVHQPVLKSVLFEVQEDRVAVSTTDLVGTSQVVIPCVAKKEQSFLVEYESLNNFVKAIKTADVIEFKVAAKASVIADGYPKVAFPTSDVKLFPKIQRPDSVDFTLRFTVSGTDLLNSLTCGEFVDPNRVPLNGIHITNSFVEATDGFIGRRVFGDYAFSDLVLPTSVTKLVSLFKNEEINVVVDKTSVYFFGDSWFLRFLTIRENYPQTEKGYENTGQNILVLNRVEIESILSILKIAGNVATVSIDYDKIKFVVSGETSAEYELELEDRQLPNEAVIEVNWLLKVLKQCKAENLTFKIGTRRQSIIIEDGENTQFFMLQWNT